MPSDIYTGNRVANYKHLFSYCLFDDKNSAANAFADLNDTLLRIETSSRFELFNISNTDLCITTIFAGRFNKKSSTDSFYKSHYQAFSIVIGCQSGSDAETKCKALDYTVSEDYEPNYSSCFKPWESDKYYIPAVLTKAPEILLPAGAALIITCNGTHGSDSKHTCCVEGYLV